MTDADQKLERVEQGLNALFAAEVAEEVFAAVDFEEILSDGGADDPVDVEQLAGALARPLGSYLARQVFDGDGAGWLAGRAVGSTVGGRVAATTFRVAVERIDIEATVESLAAFDTADPVGSVEQVVETIVEGVDSDATVAADSEAGGTDPEVDFGDEGVQVDVSGPDDGDDGLFDGTR